jgi:hypothetical protein
VLGDGSHRAAPVRALPAALAVDRRAFAVALDRDTALRRVIALDRAGRRVANVGFGLAPARLRCHPLPGAGFITVLFGFGITRGVDLTPPPGPPRLLVHDEGVRMCFSIGRFAPDGADCALPPLELSDSRILNQTAGGRTLLAALLPADVAAARVHFSGGAQQVVPTTPTVPGYTGRYAGAVRFLTLDLAPAQRVVTVDLLDASGAVLLPFPGPNRVAPTPRPTTVLRAGGVSVAAGTFGCVSVAGGACVSSVQGGVRVTAPCAPRRIIVTSRLAPSTSGLDVRVAGGRTVHARVVRLPARGGVRGRLAIAVLPARARPVELVVRSRAPVRRALRLPPATSQCGYDGDVATGL